MKRKLYKTIKMKKEKYKNSLVETFKKYNKDSKAFWGTTKIFLLKKTNKNKISKWFNHFLKAFNDLLGVDLDKDLKFDLNTHDCDYPALFVNDEEIEEDEDDSLLSELDTDISASEIIGAINALKNGKAAGPDGLIGECFLELVSPSHTIFDKVF